MIQNNINYNLMMRETLKELEEENLTPTLLLHSCCAPCSSAVLSKICRHFEITVYYYNPNITDEEEYIRRLKEQEKFIKMINNGEVDEIKPIKPIKLIGCKFQKDEWENEIKGLEKEKEGGARCYKCYNLRLIKTAKLAKEQSFDYFGTTLSVSPYKNSTWLNEIGNNIQLKEHVKYLFADFKKEEGYKLSIELSHKYGLYRQNYCGCEFSKIQRELEIKRREQQK